MNLLLLPDILSCIYSFSNGAKENPCAQTCHTEAHVQTVFRFSLPLSPAFATSSLGCKMRCDLLICIVRGRVVFLHSTTDPPPPCLSVGAHDNSAFSSALLRCAVGPCSRLTCSVPSGMSTSSATICQ